MTETHKVEITVYWDNVHSDTYFEIVVRANRNNPRTTVTLTNLVNRYFARYYWAKSIEARYL